MMEKHKAFEEAYAVAMMELAKKEGRLDRPGAADHYKVNLAARRKGSDANRRIVGFIAGNAPCNSVEIAEALEVKGSFLWGKLSNLAARQIIVSPAKVPVQTSTNTVLSRVWELGPSYEEWMEAQEGMKT